MARTGKIPIRYIGPLATHNSFAHHRGQFHLLIILELNRPRHDEWLAPLKKTLSQDAAGQMTLSTCNSYKFVHSYFRIEILTYPYHILTISLLIISYDHGDVGHVPHPDRCGAFGPSQKGCQGLRARHWTDPSSPDNPLRFVGTCWKLNTGKIQF